MNRSSLLQRSEIIGASILRICRSEWENFGRISACRAYVVLDCGFGFELLQTDASAGVRLPRIDEMELRDLPDAWNNGQDLVHGHTIADLVFSRFPSIGLLLEDDLAVFITDLGSHRVGPVILQLGEGLRCESLHSVNLLS